MACHDGYELFDVERLRDERRRVALSDDGSLSEATFRGIVREMDRLSHAELRALVTTLLVFGPEPVADTGRAEHGATRAAWNAAGAHRGIGRRPARDQGG
ncbi:MAG TPA: hypothetical protein VFX49_21100 [Chloroflexota bacterium]|nr:hypothetical protein [Chloroflexota bacterium]